MRTPVISSPLWLVVVLLVVGVAAGERPMAAVTRPTIRLGAPSQPISGEHISRTFYAAAERADAAKTALQGALQNFLEHLQRNLTTSTVLSAAGPNTIDMEKTKQQLRKLNDLSAFFEGASQLCSAFADESERFFEATKNESSEFLLKLRRVPTARRVLPMQVKLLLTNYFAEMEFFNVMYSETLDEAMEFVASTLRATQRTFIRYTDIQRDVLRNWKFKLDEVCCNRYMEFLQQWSADIFKCAAGRELGTAYDVYAMSEVTAKHVLRQLEFRIQRLYNCFIFGNHELRCRFLRHAEKDFEKLFAKLDEMQMYYDIKTQRGRVSEHYSRRRRRRRRRSQAVDAAELPTASADPELRDKCIPYGFPDTQMMHNLKTCFYFPAL